MNGKIVRIISNLYTVEVNSKKYDCYARGKFRKEEISPLVGDNVVIDIDNNYILDIDKRQNELSRPQIANVDYALIITSVKKPDLSLNLLDKQLSIIELNKIKPIIIFTKLDLLNNEEKKEIKKILKYYKSIGYIVFKNTNKFKIQRVIKNKISVLTGQTGAGKSTLLNFLGKKLDLKTQEISKSLGRGVHTTRHVELFKINKCLIADTPGFSSLSFDRYTKEELKQSFIEFNTCNCEYKDCMHLDEDNCAVKKAVENNKIRKSRYENYQKFSKEVK